MSPKCFRLVVRYVTVICVMMQPVGGVKIFLLDNTGSVRDVTTVGNKSLVHGDSFQDLSCVGDGPLEWVYEGGGKPSKVKELSRRRLDNKVRSTLHFATGNNSHDYAQHTGRYICRLLFNQSDNASIYAFFQGSEDMPFVDGSKTPGMVHLPESNLTTTLIIPCLASRPTLTPVLLRTTNGKMNPVSAPYDPLVGFQVNIPADSDPLDTMVGEYGCRAAKSSNETLKYLVFPPRWVKTSPPDTILYVGKVLNLTCEYTEPVLIKETDSNLPVYDDDEEVSLEDDIEETTETLPSNSHMANYIDTEPVPGSFGEFQCVTDNAEKRVLHEWKYFVIGKEADELSGIKFNKRKDEIRCRSKLNQPGLLSFVHCATPSECQINRVCLQKSDSCRGYKAPLKKPNHCKSGNGTPCTKIVYNGGYGFIRCVAEGIDQLLSFGGSDLRSEEEFPRLINLTLNDVTMESNTLTFNVTLSKSSYYFIEGHRWALVYANGTEEEVKNLTSVPENKFSRDVTSAEIRIAADSPKPSKIICHVPLRHSMDWEVLSVNIEQGDLPDLHIVEDAARSGEEIDQDVTTADPFAERNGATENSYDDLLTTTTGTNIIVE